MKGILKITHRARIACEEIGEQFGDEAYLDPRMKRYQFKDSWKSVKPRTASSIDLSEIMVFGTKGGRR